MDHIAQEAADVFLSVHLDCVRAVLQKRVGLLDADAEHFLQRAGILPEGAVIVFIHQCAHCGSNQSAAVLHEMYKPFADVALEHIQHRQNQQPVAVKSGAFRQDVDGDVLFKERPVVQLHCLQIIDVTVGPGGILQCPPVVPVEQDANVRTASHAGKYGGELFKLFAEFGCFPENAGVASTGMGDHRAVELFLPCDALAHLEEQAGVCAVCKGLIGQHAHFAGTLQFVVGLPVLLVRALLRQHVALPALQPPHDVVLERYQRLVVRRPGVVIPAHDVHAGGHHELVELFDVAGHVGLDGHVRAPAADGFVFVGETVCGGVGHKAHIIQLDGGVEAVVVVQFRGQLDLFPVIQRSAPEGGEPALVELFQ